MCLGEASAKRPRKRFAGSINQLQQVIRMTGVVGEWEYMPACYWRFVCRDGAILNWWPTTKTLNFQGPPAAKAALELAIAKAISGAHRVDQRLLERIDRPDLTERD